MARKEELKEQIINEVSAKLNYLLFSTPTGGINMYLISAYFDSKSETVLQNYIHRVADATGNTFMLDNNVPPHLTISAIEAKSSEILIPSFELLDGRIASGEISIVTVGQFMPRVLYVAPFLNEYLTDLQSKIFDAYINIPETTISRQYKPYSWFPHITIGKTFTKEQLVKAIDEMCDFKPIEASITKIGLSEVNPHRVVRELKVAYTFNDFRHFKHLI